MEVESSPKKSRIYGEMLSAGTEDLEIVHWLNEPTGWITAEQTGENVKEYARRWREEHQAMQICMEGVEAQLSGNMIDFKTFLWTMRQVKDHVLILRAICDRAARDSQNYRSKKILRAPAEKFYSRSATGISIVIFLCGIGTGILEFFDESPSWLVITFFIVSALSTYIANWFAERWGVRERKLRKLQKIIEQRGLISSARIMIDAMDFDESTIVAIMRQRTEIENSYEGTFRKTELDSLGRAVARMAKRPKRSALARGNTVVEISKGALSRKKEIEKMLATGDDLGDSINTPRKHRRRKSSSKYNE